MRCFVIDYRDPADVKVRSFDDEDAARANCPSEGGASVVTDEEALSAFSSEILVAVYNRIRRQPKAIKDFRDKATACRRVWTLLEAYDPTLIYSPNASAPVEETPAQEAQVVAKKAKKAKASNGTAKSPRGEKTKEIARLLQQKNGCTAAEVLEATGWPSVSMPAMAKAAGLKLRKEKVKGEKTRYWGE